MHRICTMFFTTHVYLISRFENHKQCQSRERHKSQRNFPHDGYLQKICFPVRGLNRNLALKHQRQAYKLPNNLPMLMRGSIW